MFNKLEWQRNRRKKLGNVWTHKYEKTPNGFLMRKYRNMQSRVTGVQKLELHLYGGLPILDRESFYEWAKSHETFWKMFKIWTNSNYDRKLCPTVDRIDPRKGYELSNMQWLTHSENSARTRNNHKLKI
jgi:hypothetical protein